MKSAWATFFNYFLKSNVLKDPTLILLKEAPVDSDRPLLEVGHGKIKPNRWGGRSSRMRNLHRCHSLKKFSQYEKTMETDRLGFNGPRPTPSPPLSSQRINDVYYRDNLPKIKYDAYVINLDEYSDIGTHWIALYVLNNDVTYFDSFGVEHTIKKFKNSSKIKI